MQLKLFEYKTVDEDCADGPRKQKKGPLGLHPLTFIGVACATAAAFMFVVWYSTNCRADCKNELEKEVEKFEMRIGKFDRRELPQLPEHRECERDTELVKSCLKDYYSTFEIDTKQMPPYADFFRRLQSHFEGLHEFAVDQVCLAQAELTDCLGSKLENNSCLSVKALQEYFGISKMDSREYAGDLLVRNYECKNEKFLKTNFKCLYPTTTTRKNDLDICSAELRKKLSEKKDPCASMDAYISCTREIFISECGLQVSGFICNVIRTSMEFNYPTCGPLFKKNCEW